MSEELAPVALKITPRSRRSEQQQLRHRRRWAWICTIPALIAFLLFGLYPLLLGFVVAFQDWMPIGPVTWVGLENFKGILRDSLFRKSILNTLEMGALGLGLGFLVPIIVSVLLMEMKKRTIRIMMILWFLPMADMASTVLWKWFYNVQFGLFNAILVGLGLPPSRWLNDPNLAMICLVLPGILLYGPSLVYVATVQSIPDELYEAAELEGAGVWRKVFSITLPRMRPVIAMMLILGVIGSLQAFEGPYVMTGGGPAFATYTIILYFFTMGFRNMKFGLAAAVAVVLFAITMILVAIQRNFFKEDLDK